MDKVMCLVIIFQASLLLSAIISGTLTSLVLTDPNPKIIPWWQWLWIASPGILLLPAYYIGYDHSEWEVVCRLVIFFTVAGNALFITLGISKSILRISKGRV